MNLTLRVDCVTRARIPPPAHFRQWARAALKGLRRRRVALGVRIVSEAEGAALNARYRRRHKPTNVLAFPFEAPPGKASEVLGDLVICAKVVQREARAQGKPVASHWAHLVVHGILHLRGYDHARPKDASVMENREIRILRELGFANPYV